MAVFLFDEKRWYEDDPDTYAGFLHYSITDLIVLVYGNQLHGGAIGWKSRHIKSMDGISETKLLDVIIAMKKKGIRVHAAFNTCRVDAKSPFKPHRRGSNFVDVHDSKFQLFISNLMAECAALPVSGICIDYCRTDDLKDVYQNNASIENIVRLTYKQVKYVNSTCVVSSTTTPYLDLTHPKLSRTGRKAINWANSGYQDILFDMNYGNRKGEYGDPPDMEVVYKARKLTNTPIIIMVSSYTLNTKRKPVPTNAVKFSEVLNTIFYEENIAVYTGWLYTVEHAALISQMWTEHTAT